MCGLTAANTPAPRVWVDAASTNELRIISDDGNFPLRYLSRKINNKGDTTRDVIESREGTVARMVLRDGRPLTPVEDQAERQRLTDLISSPSDFARHAKKDMSARKFSMDVIRQMPAAMQATYVPGQPQLPGRPPQVVIDFTPDPKYKPATMLSEVLTGIAGRMWVDCAAKRTLRIEGHVLKMVDMGFGILARVYPGGTVEFEQIPVGGDRWAYSKLRENLTVRAMLVKTVHENAVMDSADFKPLAAPIGYQDAIRILLATPLPN